VQIYLSRPLQESRQPIAPGATDRLAPWQHEKEPTAQTSQRPVAKIRDAEVAWSYQSIISLPRLCKVRLAWAGHFADAAGVAQGVRREVDALFKTQAEK